MSIEINSLQIAQYNSSLSANDQLICDKLATLIQQHLPFNEQKIWHRHPVWFIKGNPIVGYSKQKKGIRLMFWSGADFEESDLEILGGKFKDASIFYNDIKQIEPEKLKVWLQKSVDIQWDYKNLVKKKGQLDRL